MFKNRQGRIGSTLRSGRRKTGVPRTPCALQCSPCGYRFYRPVRSQSGFLRNPIGTSSKSLSHPLCGFGIAPLRGLELQVTMDQRFSRPLPHHPDIRLIRAMRIELILTGSKPDALPLRYAPITTAEGLEPPMQFSCNTGTRSRRLTN